MARFFLLNLFACLALAQSANVTQTAVVRTLSDTQEDGCDSICGGCKKCENVIQCYHDLGWFWNQCLFGECCCSTEEECTYKSEGWTACPDPAGKWEPRLLRADYRGGHGKKDNRHGNGHGADTCVTCEVGEDCCPVEVLGQCPGLGWA